MGLIKAIKGVSKFYKENKNEIQESLEISKKADKKISIDNSLAAFRIVSNKLKVDMFIINMISSGVFLIFYGYMIYLRRAEIVQIIIYSLLALVLIISIIFDIIYYPGKSKFLNFVEKSRVAKNKNIGKTVLKITKWSIKVFSLGFSLYGIISFGATKGSVVSLAISFGVFMIQIFADILIHSVQKYIKYMTIGIEEDISNSQILLFALKGMRDTIWYDQDHRTQKEEKMLEEIKEEILNYEPVSNESSVIKHKINRYNEYKKEILDENIEQNLDEIVEESYQKYLSNNFVSNDDDMIPTLYKYVKEKGEIISSKLDEELVSIIAYLKYYISNYASELFTDEPKEFIEKIKKDIKFLNK